MNNFNSKNAFYIIQPLVLFKHSGMLCENLVSCNALLKNFNSLAIFFFYLFPAPSEPPELSITDRYDFYEIFLKWIEPPFNAARGVILAYQISYWLVEQSDAPVFQADIKETRVLAPTTSLYIKELVPFGKYAVQILAVTEAGYGKLSNIHYAGMH